MFVRSGTLIFHLDMFFLLYLHSTSAKYQSVHIVYTRRNTNATYIRHGQGFQVCSLNYITFHENNRFKTVSCHYVVKEYKRTRRVFVFTRSFKRNNNTTLIRTHVINLYLLYILPELTRKRHRSMSFINSHELHYSRLQTYVVTRTLNDCSLNIYQKHIPR